MSTGVVPLKVVALAGLVASATYVHFRGRVRHSFLRQLTDHSTFFAPLNALVYLWSAVPSTPFLDPKIAAVAADQNVVRVLRIRPHRPACPLPTP